LSFDRKNNPPAKDKKINENKIIIRDFNIIAANIMMFQIQKEEGVKL